MTSADVSTQTPAHILSVAVVQVVQTLSRHAEAAAHAFPQPPQFAWSLLGSTQPPSHTIGCADGQVQSPPVQFAPVAHTRAHVPQLVGSVCQSTQPLVGHRLGASVHTHPPSSSHVAPAGHEQVPPPSGPEPSTETSASPESAEVSGAPESTAASVSEYESVGASLLCGPVASDSVASATGPSSDPASER